MLHPSNEEWLAVLQEFKPDVLQTDAGDFDSLEIPANIDTWAVYREENTVTGTELNTAINTVTGTYLYEGARSGRGETVDWVAARDVAENGSMILAGGLDPDNVATAIAAVQPFGVDVSSGVEIAPGQKDREKIKAFIKAAKAAGNNL